MIKGIRYTDPAWTLLKRLAASKADVVQCFDPKCLRFHVLRGGVTGEVVRNSVVKTLVVSGLLTRSRALNPTYSVSVKGLRELDREFRRNQFAAPRIMIEAECHATSVALV